MQKWLVSKKNWHLFLRNFYFENSTLDYISSLLWHFSKICRISITNTWDNSMHKDYFITYHFFNCSELKMYQYFVKFYIILTRIIKIWFYFCMSCYLWSTLLMYLEEKFKFISMMFCCDDLSTFRFSNSLDLFCMVHYLLESSYYSSKLGGYDFRYIFNCCMMERYPT